MNALEKRQAMRRDKGTTVRFHADVADEMRWSLERQKAKAERERREAGKQKHLPPSTPVQPWTKEAGASKMPSVFVGDQKKARESRQLRSALRLLSTGD